MKEIKLTQGKVALVSDEDYENLNQFKWFAAKNYKTFYAARQSKRVNGKQQCIWMHREIMNPDSKLTVDHIDRNGLNNQRSNLRVVTIAENLQNRGIQVNNNSGYKGVSWESDREKWRVNIMVNRKLINIGRYDNIDHAIEARRNAVKMYHPFESLQL